jgi:ABC-2 type transport system permease protein
MLALLKKEIHTFFNSPIGYLVIGVFLVLNGLFLWVFDGDFNILNSGVASLQNYFVLAPWILLFLAPAVTMRSFSDEKKQGTLEVLLTKPLSYAQLVLGKFLGSFCLVLIAIIPTITYVYALRAFALDGSSLDYGSILGSYLGLIFLIAPYVAIGVFSSALTENQIVAFILAVFICFVLYYGFEGLSGYDALGGFINVESLGMSYHYNSMSRGVLDSRDIIYFLSITTAFILFTILRIKTSKS